MEIIKGDLFKLIDQNYFDIVIHGCNCFNVMGNGIAKQFKTIYPEVFKTDMRTIKGDKDKLGKYTITVIQNKKNKLIHIINAYTQYYYGGGVNADYKAIESVFYNISQNFSKNKKIAYPLIGCGLAGGDWNIVSDIIDRCLLGFDHYLVKLK